MARPSHRKKVAAQEVANPLMGVILPLEAGGNLHNRDNGHTPVYCV